MRRKAKNVAGEATPRSRRARAARDPRLEPAMMRRSLDAIHRVMREAEESDDESLAEVVTRAIRERDEQIASLQEEVAARPPSAEGCVAVTKERDRLKASLENVRALVAREAARSQRQTIDPSVAGHLLRFCEWAGVKGSILRGADSEPVCDCPRPTVTKDGVCLDCCGRVVGELADEGARQIG